MKVEVKKCPKCGSSFECNQENILKCACMKVPLNNLARQTLAEQYNDCLCLNCLKEISQLTTSPPPVD